MKKQFLPILVAGALGLCMMLFADVKTDYSHTVDFGKFRSYSWIKVQTENPLWQDRVKSSIDMTLQEKGWQQADGHADAGIVAFGSTKNQQTLNTFYDTLGGGWFWGGFDGTSTTTVTNTPVGTLVVDIFDNSSKKLIWRGIASDTVSGDPEKNEKKLEHSVQDMFKHFPPKAKG